MPSLWFCRKQLSDQLAQKTFACELCHFGLVFSFFLVFPSFLRLKGEVTPKNSYRLEMWSLVPIS